MPDVIVRDPSTGTSVPVHDAGVRRPAWEGVGEHGYVYLDSLADTGGTLVPRRARTAGGTGTFGDPLFEALTDEAQDFAIFAVAVPEHLMLTVDCDYAWDVVTVTPRRERLRRPAVRLVEVPQQVNLQDVLAQLRRRAGLPVGDLAAMLGVSRRQFYNWLSSENEPDREQEDRVRRTAEMVEGVSQRYTTPRMVRGALLARTDHGTAFDAFSEGDLGRAAIALAAAAGIQPRDVPAPSQRVYYDREQVLLELEHQRDVSRRGDG